MSTDIPANCKQIYAIDSCCPFLMHMRGWTVLWLLFLEAMLIWGFFFWYICPVSVLPHKIILNQEFWAANVKNANVCDLTHHLKSCFNHLYMLRMKNSIISLMPSASANNVHLCVWNCNGILTTSGSNVDVHDLPNIGYQVAFHDISCYLWLC